MDLIKISDTKLKIMLTASDMTYYDLHNETISIADRHVRSVLKRLLEDAKEQTGFDSDISHLYVQMYPCVGGGCELFISKPDTPTADGEPCPMPVLPAVSKQGRALRASERNVFDTCTYSFARLEDLIAVCRRLESVGFCGQSCAYVDFKHTYFLVLSGFCAPSLYSPDEYCFLGEYGDRESPRAMQGYLCEYCRMICAENAVRTLMRL
ncbi:MAG: adaptor protein MecA [Clostridia bacterium]|jgi:negative regulator of genetic competence, sporulation and motility|nr:adaptor protein MecA [Clostridia bacterium]MBQ5361827.1 adaptor protein MecA [Clostridia bacterium]